MLKEEEEEEEWKLVISIYTKMGSQGNGRIGRQDHHHLQQNLDRKGSVCGLTLKQVQDQLGEPLHGMNLDELLRNVLPAEGDQSSVIDLESPSPHPPSCSGTVLETQGSLNISSKTVDEVWRDIQYAESKSGVGEEGQAPKSRRALGEMTLEDFLVKASVVSGVSKKQQHGTVTGPVGDHQMEESQRCQQGMHWLQQYHQMSAFQPQQTQRSVVGSYLPCRPVPRPPMVGIVGAVEAGIQEGQITPSSPVMGNFCDARAPALKRVAPGEMAEKTVGRRQKRMIKNRESAARSRARKQAYTNELENKITRLEEENQMLKKQKELEKRLLSDARPPDQRSRLRRTSSNPF